nr:putative DNA (cytosine-5)-methyltransferase CMT1 [Tanacetum cinerariifolium]
TSSYFNQPQKESINLINVFNNSSEDFLEGLFLKNQPSGNPTFSSHHGLTSPKVKDYIFDPEGGNVLPEKFLDLNSTKDLHPSIHINLLSGSTTYSSSPNQLLKELVDELALITFPLKYDDDLQFENESDLKEIEYLLHHDLIQDIDSSLKDSINQSNLANLADNGEKIKESKLLIDELDLPCDFLPSSDYDSFPSEEFSRVDALPSTNNEDKLATSNASLVLEDFNPSLYELAFFKEVPSILGNLKTHAEGFCPPVFISSASLGNQGANFRDLPDVIVNKYNEVGLDTKIERKTVASGKPLVPDYALKFVKRKSSKLFGRLWWDEIVSTVVTRPQPHN